MGLSSGAVKLYLELWQRKMLANVESVVDMGSQELHLRQAEFEGFIEAAGISDYDKSPFANLANYPGHPRCSAKPFYELLGASNYRCIDLGKQHEAIPLDLNEPLTDENLYGQFDMVTDHGTNEHVFNIAETYRTMHRLCKPDGLIVINQCLYGGNGYYNFDLSFFEGMAAANNYNILFCSYIVTPNVAPNTDSWVGQYHIPISRDLLNVLDWSKVRNVEISYAFKKTSDADFQYAYQGTYLSSVQGNYGYQLQFLPDPPSRTYVPLIRGSRDGADADVLGSIGTTRLAKHLIWRLSGRIKGRVARKLRRVVKR